MIPASHNHALVAGRLRTNGLEKPLAIEGTPEFSWVFRGPDGAQPSSAKVELFDALGALVWRASWRVGTIPVLEYGGDQLPGSSDFTWTVTTSDESGVESTSAAAEFSTALTEPLPERARWIGLTVEEGLTEATPVQYLRRSFELAAEPVRARLHVAALGWIVPWVNGVSISETSITPRFTALDHRVEYETFDVAAQLSRGRNVVGLQLAEGRYRGKVGGGGLRGAYGNQLAALAVLEILTADGERVEIMSDGRWEGGYGPVLTADPQDGAHIDSRVRGADFTNATGSDWAAVSAAIEFGVGLSVEPAPSERVTVVSELSPVAITEVEGCLVVDFGQNISGVTSAKVAGDNGQAIKIHHSELMRADGRIDRDYLNQAEMIFTQAIDRYVLDGSEQVFVPPLTMRGFQFVEIEGLKREQLHSITALGIAADLDYYGHFESSLPELNRLHENIVWSMRGNFTDLPTDCPTRERSGWTGDAQVFAPAAAYLADVKTYYADWLRDVALQQDPDGAVRDIVPREVGGDDHPMSNLVPLRGAAGWADSITLIPWTLYQHYGRIDVAREQWDAMVAWVEFTRRRAAENRQQDRSGEPLPHERYLVDTGYNWGEHLAGDDPIQLETLEDMIAMMLARNTKPDAEVATAYFARSAYVLGQMAAALGKEREAEEYLTLWEHARNAYQTEFLGADGLPDDHRQAPWVRPLAFDLIPEPARQAAADRLAKLVVARGNRVGTGFLSTGFLLEVLSRAGHADTALDVLLQRESPSWLAEVEQGATTIWESYDGVGSRNHYSLGAIVRWFYEDLAGLRAQAPGWTRATISPLLSTRVDRVTAETTTPFGEIGCTTELIEDVWSVSVTVPPGMHAQLVLPGQEAIELPSGRSTWSAAVGAAVVPV